MKDFLDPSKGKLSLCVQLLSFKSQLRKGRYSDDEIRAELASINLDTEENLRTVKEALGWE